MAKKLLIKAVGYVRRFNLGNYEHEEYSTEAVIEDGQDPVEAMAQLKGAVSAAKASEEIPWGETGVSKSDKKSDKPAAGKKAASKKAAQVEEAEEEDESEDDEDLEDADDESEDEAEEEGDEDEESEDDEDEESDDEDEDEEEEAPAPAKKKAASKKVAAEPKKKFKSKATTYSRNSDLHKKLFVEAVKETMGADWLKKNAGRGKTVSIKLEGKDFLDSEGQVLAAFKAELKKLAKAK